MMGSTRDKVPREITWYCLRGKWTLWKTLSTKCNAELALSMGPKDRQRLMRIHMLLSYKFLSRII